MTPKTVKKDTEENKKTSISTISTISTSIFLLIMLIFVFVIVYAVYSLITQRPPTTMTTQIGGGNALGIKDVKFLQHLHHAKVI